MQNPESYKETFFEKIQDHIRPIIKTSIIISLLFIGLAFAPNLVSIWNQGNIITPSNMTTDPTVFDWGTIERGTTYYKTTTLTNTGDQTFQNLNIVTANWQNQTDLGLYLSWDATGKTINPYESLTAQFTLTVAIGSFPNQPFTFDIVILGDII